MAVTAKNIKDCFAEFAGLSDARVDKFRLQAERRVNLVQWGEKADDAILWLSAHTLKIAKQMDAGDPAVAGPLSQKKVGDISVGYAGASNLKPSQLRSTVYGQHYLDLKTGIFPTRVLA